MTDDQRYQNWLQGHSPEQQQANDDRADICVEAIMVLVAYPVWLSASNQIPR